MNLHESVKNASPPEIEPEEEEEVNGYCPECGEFSWERLSFGTVTQIHRVSLGDSYADIYDTEIDIDGWDPWVCRECDYHASDEINMFLDGYL